jgi:hypothetical protein
MDWINYVIRVTDIRILQLILYLKDGPKALIFHIRVYQAVKKKYKNNTTDKRKKLAKGTIQSCLEKTLIIVKKSTAVMETVLSIFLSC